MHYWLGVDASVESVTQKQSAAEFTPRAAEFTLCTPICEQIAYFRVNVPPIGQWILTFRLPSPFCDIGYQGGVVTTPEI